MAIKVNGKFVAGGGGKGEDGKSAYDYAVDGGYTGTEAEFQKLMAQAQNLDGGPFLPLSGGEMTGNIIFNNINSYKDIYDEKKQTSIISPIDMRFGFGVEKYRSGNSFLLDVFITGITGSNCLMFHKIDDTDNAQSKIFVTTHTNGGIHTTEDSEHVVLSNVETPTRDYDVSNKKYVDESIQKAISDSWAKAY